MIAHEHIKFDPLDATWLAGNAELYDQIEALAYAAADVTERFAGDPNSDAAVFARLVVDQQREAVQAELGKRERLFAAGQAVSDPHDGRHEAWRDLARHVRETADVVLVLQGLGYQPHRSGRNGPRGTDEFHGACPACGGVDRFISWPPGSRPSRGLCRQCGYSADAIQLVRSFVPGCDGWRSAIAYLATQTGMPMPTTPQPSGRRVVRLTPKVVSHAS